MNSDSEDEFSRLVKLQNVVQQDAFEARDQLTGPEVAALASTAQKVRAAIDQIRCRERVAKRKRNRRVVGRRSLNRLHKAHFRAVTSSRRATLQRLFLEIGIIADRLKACQAWLYIAGIEEGKVVLRADVTHRTNQRGRKITLDEESLGIVAKVARERQSYLAANTGDDPCYVECNAKTISEVAVPILDADENLLGVLNLESSFRHFSTSDEESLIVAARRLAVGLLCLRSNTIEVTSPWPWSPDQGRWSGRSVPEHVSWAVSTSLGESSQVDSCNCIIWGVDRVKQQLWVYGTTSYDALFQADESLHLDDSYTGVVAKLPQGSVKSHTPTTAPKFKERDRAKASGLKRMLSAPMYRMSPDVKGDNLEAWSVFHAYYFGSAVSKTLPSRRPFEDIANLIETWLSGYERLRSDCALVYLAWKMASSELEWRRKHWRVESIDVWSWSVLVGLQLNLLKDVLQDVLDADGCTIFVPNPQRTRLIMATSTGVGLDERFDAQFLATSGDNRNPVFYELGSPDEYGVLSYLHDHPESGPVRINSLLAFENENEIVIPADLPRRVVRKHMEPLSEDTEDRRFLGGTLAEGGKTTAVLRIVRSIHKPPFTEDDLRLLDRMLLMCQEKRLWCGSPPVFPIAGADAAEEHRATTF